jgi:hypothetical protein
MIPPIPKPPAPPSSSHSSEDVEFDVSFEDVDDPSEVSDPWGDESEEVQVAGVALEAVQRESKPRPPVPPVPSASSFEMLMDGAAELFSLGDFSGSLEIVEKAFEIRPTDKAAKAFLEKNQQTLTKMFESKLSGLQKKPRVKVDPAEIMWLSIDHRAGFVLSQIDGLVSYEDLLQLSGMSRFETLRILAKLCEEGVIESA